MHTMRTNWLILVAMLAACSPTKFHRSWTREQAPETYQAVLNTTKGDVEISVTRSWSPRAADRFYQLVRHHALDGILFYRVVPDFVAQFGEIDTVREAHWKKTVIIDEPVLKGNTRGRISFARSGVNTRSIHLFINLRDNSRLDTVHYNGVHGFPAFGEVSKGMDVVDALYNGYSNSTMALSDSIGSDRKRFMAMFPQLDSIRKAELIK